jgi:hypothetical protein
MINRLKGIGTRRSLFDIFSDNESKEGDMSQNNSKVFLLTILLAIVTLFGCAHTLTHKSGVAQHVLATDVLLKFADPDGKKHVARIKRNEPDPKQWKIYVDGKDITEISRSRELNEFSFCEQDKEGKTTIGDMQYSCHVVMEASDGAFLIGNHSCPLFLNPPGIVINLCPGGH